MDIERGYRIALETLTGILLRIFSKLKSVETVKCKYCGLAEAIVLYGLSRSGEQRYYCKKCRKAFLANEALPSMRTPIRQVGATLSMWYGGMPLKEIRRHSEQQYRAFPSRSTLYRWLSRFSRIAVDEAQRYKPKVGDIWVADETVLKIGGENLWFWDLIDYKTRFLLASHISNTRTTRDAFMLMRRAESVAGKTPKEIHTDKLQAYLDGIELAFGADTKHIPVKGITAEQNTNVIERFHGSLKSRTKIMRGLKHRETARRWLIET